MKRQLSGLFHSRVLVFLYLFCFLYLLYFPSSAHAQTFPTPDYWRRVVLRPVSPAQIPGPESLQDFVAGGKLRLTLDDAVQLTIKNNTDVRINQLTYENSQFAVKRAYAPFDPLFTTTYSANRSTTPSISQLEGGTIVSSLSQQSQSSYAQTYQTGTRTTINFNSSRSVSSNTFLNVNPSISANMSFNISQPLLRNRGLYPNRAPIVIAQRSQKQSRANFEVQVSDSVQRAIDQYWGVVQARENLAVLRKSLELSEATYARNKRELELGALPPLDIYRSESQVATRRVSVIQAEYNLKQLEDDFRRTIGADLDPYIRALDLDLVQPAEPTGDLLALDSQEALQRALQKRPELESLRLQLQNDDTSVRLAHNSLQPDLNFSVSYSASGVGGNQQNPTPPPAILRGGLGDALQQVGGFDFPGYGFTLRLSLPIRSRSAEADLGSAMISKRRDLYSLRSREQAITLEVRNAIHQLEQAKLSMAAAKIARDLAVKNLEAEQRKYELGVQTIFFVLDAQTQLATAEQGLLQAYVSYQRAVTAVERGTGALLDRFRIQLAQ
ncbi:MAG: TolC family protein [Acidobacteria bacterium]|nr:TolC family protein [Acidobacteriota bacterium]MCL5287576.1 TolC family protein [Acidobacteriota bacterium]